MRVFDTDMANKVVEQLEEEGVDTRTHTNVKSVKELKERTDTELGEYEVELEVKGKGIEKVKVNTILVAIGRDPNPDSLQY
jgi:pyruvate/2-oxoglutarate dehydrogenase complex dihydrolipoamide dehydrogenase (E3) component